MEPILSVVAASVTVVGRDSEASDPPRQDTEPLHDLLGAALSIQVEVGRLAQAAGHAWSLNQSELRRAVAEACAARSAFEAGWLSLVKALDDSPGPPDGSPPGCADGVPARTNGARAFLIEALHFSPAQAALDVAAAHALDLDSGDLPAVGTALLEGAITRAHADAAVRVARDLPRRLATAVDPETGRTGMATADAFLAQHARVQSPKTVAWLGEHLLSRLAPDRADRHDPDAVLRRTASRAWDSTGMLRGSFQMDGAAGAAFTAVWDALSGPNPAGTAIDENGQQVLVRDERTRPVRLVDALSAMGRLAAVSLGLRPAAPGLAPPSDPDEPHGPRSRGAVHGPATPVLISLTATVDQVAAAEDGARHGVGLAHQHTGGRGPVSAWLLARLSCDAVLQRVLLAPAGGVLDLGRRVRLATPSQRRALVARDGGCVIPGCTAPPESCDLHHLVPWSHGGPTDLANLALVCSRHHTAVHAGHWTLVMDDGVPWAIPARWVDPKRRRLRNTAHETARIAHQIGEQLRLLLDDP